MIFEIVVEKRALFDIQCAIDYYDQQQIGLGKKFLSEIEKHFSSINRNPFYQIRYNRVRCLPVIKFPFMIHFLLDEKEKTAYIISVFHTSQNPDKWTEV
ncbi:MAG: type II toxin-antitoxin system RelE/ParE family toxin [Bacteroidetes bacterium]|nr:MAG: type II toxin-antitoxin system RelE/ParE family toxin [Bacteroidota bacterium]